MSVLKGTRENRVACAVRYVRRLLIAWFGIIALALALSLFAMLMWISFPSTLLIRPASWKYDPSIELVIFTREVYASSPLLVFWEHRVYSPELDDTCTASGMRRLDPAQSVEYVEVDPKLMRCLRDPMALAMLSWAPYWGPVQMKPVVLSVPTGAVLPPPHQPPIPFDPELYPPPASAVPPMPSHPPVTFSED